MSVLLEIYCQIDVFLIARVFGLSAWLHSAMFLPNRLLLLELRRVGCYKSYLQYMRCICKVEACILRLKFLENCLKSDIIPKFLKFRVPNNGCFDDESVHDFQRRLLRKEIVSAKNDHGQNLMKLGVKNSPSSISYNKLIFANFWDSDLKNVWKLHRLNKF